MAETNPHQTWRGGVNTAFRELRNKSKKANVVPLGQERLTPAESKARFTQMSPEAREKFIAEQGPEEVIRMLRG